MQRRNCCKRSTAWRKRRHGIGSRSEKPAPAGSFRRAQSWRRCCRRFRLLSCLSWRCIFHGSWENNSKFQMGGLRETGGLLLFSPVRAHLLTTAPEGAAVVLALGKPCALRGGLRLLRQPPDNATAPMGAAVIVCADGKFPATSAENWGRNSLPYVAACLRKPATGSFAAEMDGRSARPFSLCERETEKRNEVNERWQFTIWKQKWSAGAQGAPPWPPLLT